MDSPITTEYCRRCQRELPFLQVRSNGGKQVATKMKNEGLMTERITMYETLSVGPFDVQVWRTQQMTSHSRRFPFDHNRSDSPPSKKPSNKNLLTQSAPTITSMIQNGKKTFRLSGFLPNQGLPVFTHRHTGSKSSNSSPRHGSRSPSPEESRRDSSQSLQRKLNCEEDDLVLNDDNDGYRSPFGVPPPGKPSGLSSSPRTQSEGVSQYQSPYQSPNPSPYQSPLGSPLRGSGYSAFSAPSSESVAYHINFYRNGELIRDPSSSSYFKKFKWASLDCWPEHSFTESELTNIISQLLNTYGTEADRSNLMHVCDGPERNLRNHPLPSYSRSIRSAS